MTALYPRLTGLRPCYDRGWPRYIALRNGPILPPLPSGVQGAQPPPGVQGKSPCTQKRWRVGRRDNGAGQTRPSAEGRRRPQQDHHRPGRPPPTPIAKCELLCYSIPNEVGPSPLLFLGACRIHEHWGLTMENPPVAGALREQPKGQDPPRKAGTGENAAVRHRLFEAAQLRNGS